MKAKPRQGIRQGIILLSFCLFPATFIYFSPVVIIEATQKGIINGSFVVFAALFFCALVLGRGFCGWLCPGAGCQEALFAVKDRRITSGNWIKWAIWLPWIGAIAVTAWYAGGYVKIDPLFMTAYGLSVHNLPTLIAYLSVLLILIVLPALLVGRRSFCHHLCWVAPFMMIGRWLRNRVGWSSLRLSSQPTACVHCGWCTQSCPMSLPVEQLANQTSMEHPDCILCASCADTCPKDVIHLGMGKDV